MSASYLHELVADASALDPGEQPLRDVVAAHVTRRGTTAPELGSPAELLGPLAVFDSELPALQEIVAELGDRLDDGRLDVSVVVSGGAGAIEPAVRWATRQPGLRLVGLAASVRDLDDLARGAHRVAAMVTQLEVEGLLEDTRVVVILPLYGRAEGASRWQHALDTLAMEDLSLGLRTGGGAADDVPDAGSLAGAISDALDREVPFTCSGGLAHAVASLDDRTGALRHGFLNVLQATRASLDGDDVDAVAEVLSQTTPEAVVESLAGIGEPALTSARRWFTGFDSGDVDVTLADLRALGLIG